MPPATKDVGNAREIIRHQFGIEILTKHNELRLIDQELAKCQIALEQLRRCHLIPYPVNCPTPEQMLHISAGTGSALRTQYGASVPKWAPPFGVVDGPYARHYAHWLIPDPSFDGVEPESHFGVDAFARGCTIEGRTTRNSAVDVNASRGRGSRGSAGNRLQALPNAHAPPKEKPLYCTVKRADGITVKLICVDCNRFNFSSTQGFINHCRIAHKRDYKSHEEAAVHCGKPIDTPTLVEERTGSTSSISTGTDLVHPFAQPNMTDAEAFVALQSRIKDSLKLFEEGRLPNVTHIPVGSASSTGQTVTRNESTSSHSFRGSSDTPHLSQLMASRNFNGNLEDLVADARTRVPLDDLTPGDESEDVEPALSSFDGASDALPARSSVMMRMPARTTTGQSASAQEPADHPISSKGRSPHMSFIPPPNSAKGMLIKQSSNHILSDEDIDMEDANLSPNTLVSNNAPSLVSDDGEYSDEGSSVSGASDGMDTDSVSDVAEITLDDEHDTRTLRRGSSGVSGAVPLRKEEPKHVTFINPVKGSTKERRPHKA